MTRVYSVGHSNLDAAAFEALLEEAGVRALADVRRRPVSRWPWFRRDALARRLAVAGIEYLWLGDGLGGLREPKWPRAESRNRALADPSLRAYADAQSDPAFARDLEALLALAARTPTAVMCAERDWRHCHRQILADVLVARSCEVLHLATGAAPEPHRLADAARVEGGTVSYPSLL
jgi:uncharacterized protein (DUF488 family)